jgi:hypothetical protein
MAHEAFAEDAHETGEHDQIGREAVDALGQRGIEGFAPGKGLVVDVMPDDAGPGGGLQPAASGRLLITATILTGRLPASRAAISASMLLPRPEIRMTIFFISKNSPVRRGC